MKKVLFSLSLLLCLALGAQAQHAGCSKACTDKSKSSCEVKVATATPIPSEYQTAAAKVASLDATIVSRTNPETAEVTYYRKEAAAHSGEVSYVALNFDPATSTFVNVSPSQVAAKENTQGCGSSKSASASKSCCAAGASTKSCCADKAKTTSTTSATTAPAPVKATKASGGSKD